MLKIWTPAHLKPKALSHPLLMPLSEFCKTKPVRMNIVFEVLNHCRDPTVPLGYL
jgi:hypothetical protein